MDVGKAMRVYVKYHDPLSFAINRVIAALIEYAPSSVEFIDDWREADLHVYHVTGKLHHHMAWCKTTKSYAAIQYTLRASRNKSTVDWMPFWKGAKAVWSYYDLAMLCREDGVKQEFNFYHAPLGVDNRIFKKYNNGEREYMICTTGGLWETESVRECVLAAESLGGKTVHLGPHEVGAGRNFECFRKVDDATIVDLFNKCKYVAGLRRAEGFELPAAEGIFCGARPVVFDSPHYRQWYDGIAEFIPENSREETIESLRSVFSKEWQQITDSELAEAKNRFDWQRIVTGFWETCL